jgi:L-asparagine transporter-like permease
MSQDGGFARIVEREGGLRRSLGAGRLTMIAIGGAIGTGLFLGSGFAIGLAGPAVLGSYAIGAVIALLLMGCLAEMTVAHTTSGSFGAYAEYYLGPLAGFLVRYAYWTCIVLAVGTEVTAIALYMRLWFPQVPGWVWIVGFSALLILVNARSVTVFGAVEYWFSAIKIAAILIFIALASYVLWHARAPGTAGAAGFANYTAHGGFFPRGVWGMWVAVILAIFSYLSIEMIAVAAGEAAHPERAVIRAFRATLARLIVFYLVTIALILALVPWNAVGVEESPFVRVLRALAVPGAAAIFNLVLLVAALSAMNSQLYITTRMMFSLARAGYAPRRFGQLSARGVPLQALTLSSLGIALAAVLSVTASGSAYILMVSVASFGAMFTWMMIFVTHYFFRRARATAPAQFRMRGFPYTTLLGALLMAAVLLTTAFTDAFRMTLVFGLPYLAILCLVYRLKFQRERDRERLASSAHGAALLDEREDAARIVNGTRAPE